MGSSEDNYNREENNEDDVDNLNTQEGSVTSEDIDETITNNNNSLQIEKVEENDTLSYEDERSQIDFDDVVNKSMSSYREERVKSNRSVLEQIEREEGEDRPRVQELLKWAKGTKAPKTETFKIKK